MTPMSAAVISTGILGILLFGLGFGVSLTRGRTKTNYGALPDPTDRMYKWVRAHGNAAEYAPMLAILMLLVGAAVGSEHTWVAYLMYALVAGRLLHAAGMITCSTLDGINPLRFVGALLTYLGGLALSVLVLIYAAQLV